MLYSFIIIGCTEEEIDFPKFYKYSFTDNINFQVTLDTLNIILEQKKNHIKVLDSVPYRISNFINLSDSIMLKLYVSYEGYIKEPEIKKDILIKQDSVFVWYSLLRKVETVPAKSNSVTKPNTSPRISFTSVDSIEIYKSSHRTIFFKSINY